MIWSFVDRIERLAISLFWSKCLPNVQPHGRTVQSKWPFRQPYPFVEILDQQLTPLTCSCNGLLEVRIKTKFMSWILKRFLWNIVAVFNAPSLSAFWKITFPCIREAVQCFMCLWRKVRRFFQLHFLRTRCLRPTSNLPCSTTGCFTLVKKIT